MESVRSHTSQEGLSMGHGTEAEGDDQECWPHDLVDASK